MGPIGLLFSILSGILTVYLFNNAEIEEEYLGKIWSFIFGVLLLLLTIYLFSSSIEYAHKILKLLYIAFGNNIAVDL